MRGVGVRGGLDQHVYLLKVLLQYSYLTPPHGDSFRLYLRAECLSYLSGKFLCVFKEAAGGVDVSLGTLLFGTVAFDKFNEPVKDSRVVVKTVYASLHNRCITAGETGSGCSKFHKA